ncbi:MAG TPA: efflux RND transporter periplasmic adaptor subunit [Candidatus Thiothrix moscowensis]|uniref:efflux RND transporter periplasmic adaptor subunit n=1 Tax=unclassified Thiothrix TaxID=2636184 RepID=UPI0025CCB275|nr:MULTISPECIES: efflux RND transporter periplasmic adaptor subunit [unclassified Thiothrix]HRJ52823.1 efflux RND transporter periplasmic adaptor subunit [Candidatus Thiothrix moscowensis]HRJ94408.1 efflux RND transporter periplasmic adaptor subunit [Candidatus Thiothrix moscowensis]
MKAPMMILFAGCMLSSLSAHALEMKGRLEWVHKVDMRVVESGVVEEVNITTGQHVNKGDVLLRMDQRKQKASLLEAKARVARAKLGIEDAEREKARTQELFDQGLIAEEELKDNELKHAVAQTEMESANAAEEAAKVALEHTELKAPFAGVVASSAVWQGAVIFAGKQDQPLVSLAPDDQMLARVLVTADVLRNYPTGASAQVLVNGANRSGKVYRQGVEAVRIEPEGAIYELDIVFKRTAKELLRPSESVKVILP